MKTWFQLIHRNVIEAITVQSLHSQMLAKVTNEPFKLLECVNYLGSSEASIGNRS